MMSSTLDGLLNDLELACQEKPKQARTLLPSVVPPDSHLATRRSPTSTSDRSPTLQDASKEESDLNYLLNSSFKKESVAPPVPQRDLSSVMATTAVNNSRVASNLNELDVLLEDLSNARFGGNSNMIEQKSESVMTSSSVSYQSSGFYPSDNVRPLSAERKSPSGMLRTPMEDAVIREMSSKMVERQHSSSSSTFVTSEESKWQYVGNGLWENGQNGDHGQNGHQNGKASLTSPLDRKKQVDTLNLATSYHQSSRHKASSATQELDDLMQSLNTFQLRDRIEEPVNTNLDAMLGDLQDDMVKQGVKMTQKGECAACDKPIVGQVVTALGKTFHPEHFTCAKCNQELGSQNFFERENQPYCEDCYQNLFSPRCARCQGAILDKCVSALGQNWHPECFVCFDCGNDFGEDGFHEKDDQAYCKDCYFGMFAPKCAGCKQPITDNSISALGGQWHPGCFVCATCNQPFTDGNYFEHEGQPYCETHFHAMQGSLCAGCSKPISGRCITAMFRKFHPEHFVCSFCLKQLNKGTFKEKGEKPYCHECFNRLFG